MGLSRTFIVASFFLVLFDAQAIAQSSLTDLLDTLMSQDPAREPLVRALTPNPNDLSYDAVIKALAENDTPKSRVFNSTSASDLGTFCDQPCSIELVDVDEFLVVLNHRERRVAVFETKAEIVQAHLYPLPDISRLGSEAEPEDYEVHVTMRDEYVDVTIKNHTGKTLCVRPEAWAYSFGFGPDGGHNISIEVNDELYSQRPQPKRHITSNDPTYVVAGKLGTGLKTSIHLSDFGVPEALYETAAIINYDPPVPFFCDPLPWIQD
ncbi:MAG: hypothetical protein AAFV59_14485 [Pseudomonadota bacterium]